MLDLIMFLKARETHMGLNPCPPISLHVPGFTQWVNIDRTRGEGDRTQLFGNKNFFSDQLYRFPSSFPKSTYKE